METSILVTLFLIAIVFGAGLLSLVVYTVKHESRRGDDRRSTGVDDDPRLPVER